MSVSFDDGVRHGLEMAIKYHKEQAGIGIGIARTSIQLGRVLTWGQIRELRAIVAHHQKSARILQKRLDSI